jgi:hypothetical protein
LSGWTDHDTRQAIRDLEYRLAVHEQAVQVTDPGRHRETSRSLQAELEGERAVLAAVQGAEVAV